MEKIVLNIQICSSWSYKGYFNNFKEILERNFKNVDVNGFNFPLSGFRLYFYSFAFIIFGLIILSVFFTGIMKPFLKIFFNEEHIKMINENKVQIILISYFAFNIILNVINNTGAFEIFYKDEIIFSKLNEGNFPEINEIIKILVKKGAKFEKK